MASRNGFTLIELSIVLVIIGLIVGGVLVGQDLIKAAEVRATVGQYEKYNAAVNTFRTKYNGLPGDLLASSATAFGLYSSGMTGSAGLGDGNGLLEGGSTGQMYGVGETLAFWRHLSDAGLIDGSFGSGTYLASGAVPSTDSNPPSVYVPAAKVGRGSFFAVATDNHGANHYVLGGITAIPSSGIYTFTESLTPIETFNIDTKIDDGMPNTGAAQARGAGDATHMPFTKLGGVGSDPASYASTPVAGTCITTGSSATDPANTYARASSSGTSPACLLRMRFN